MSKVLINTRIREQWQREKKRSESQRQRGYVCQKGLRWSQPEGHELRYSNGYSVSYAKYSALETEMVFRAISFPLRVYGFQFFRPYIQYSYQANVLIGAVRITQLRQ